MVLVGFVCKMIFPLCVRGCPIKTFFRQPALPLNTHRYKVFATRKEPRGGVKNTPEEILQYLGSLMSDFDEIFTVYSQMNLAYNRIKIFELLLRMTS